MKRLLQLAFCLLLLPAVVMAQDDESYQFVSPFPDTTGVDTTITIHANYGVNGVAVDSTGKVWVAGYYSRVPFQISEDSTVNTKAIFVYNPDGTQASFSPIQTITVGTDVDTLFSPLGGLRTDHNGDILASFANILYRIDSETGEGLAKLDPGAMRDAETPAFISGIGVTQEGFVMLSYVFGGTPVQIWDPTLTSLINTVDEARGGFSRSGTISKDGMDVYVPLYPTSAVLRYHSDLGAAGTYSVPDTLFKGISSETIGFNHVTGNLWLSGGSVTDAPNQFPGVESNYVYATMYGFDPETGALVDSFRYNNAEAQDNVKLRGIAFSPDGQTAYIGNFYPFDVGVQKFALSPVIQAIERPDGIPDAMTLSQNYPNPFSQSTQIEFGLHKTGPVTLKVYDVLGREVRTLVDRVMPVSENHVVTFEAGNLPSGMYFYQLRTENHQLSGKMLLVK